MEKVQTLQNLVTPILYHDESRQPYLLDVLSDRPSSDQLSHQNELRKIGWTLFISFDGKILIGLFLTILWNTLIKITIFLIYFYVIVATHQNILMTHVFNIIENLRHFRNVIGRKLFERINAPSNFTARIVIISSIYCAIWTFWNKLTRLHIPIIWTLALWLFTFITFVYIITFLCVNSILHFDFLFGFRLLRCHILRWIMIICLCCRSRFVRIILLLFFTWILYLFLLVRLYQLILANLTLMLIIWWFLFFVQQLITCFIH